MAEQDDEVLREIRAAIAELPGPDQSQIHITAQALRTIAATKYGTLAIALIGAEIAAAAPDDE